jgi:hypothetical protein
MNNVNLLQEAFNKIDALGLSADDYLKVITIMTDYGISVRKETYDDLRPKT